MDNPNKPPQPPPPKVIPPEETPILTEIGRIDEHLDGTEQLSPEAKRGLIIVGIAFAILVILFFAGAIWLFNQPPMKVAYIRDIFIIFMALMSLVTLLVMVVLMVQLARLLNLLQNEIGPILVSMNVTISNLRGTTLFLSENLTEPVIKLNEYLAGLSQLFALLGLSRKPPKS